MKIQEKRSKDCEEVFYAFFYTINKQHERNTTQRTDNIGQERTKYSDTHLDLNKLVNVRRYLLKSNYLTDTEKDSIEKQVVADIQQNKSITLEMNTVKNDTDKH